MASSKGSFRLRKRSAGRIKTVPSPTDDAVDQESIMEEGYLQKRGRGRKSSICKIQKRYILLTTDGIFYYNEKVSFFHIGLAIHYSIIVPKLSIKEHS